VGGAREGDAPPPLGDTDGRAAGCLAGLEPWPTALQLQTAAERLARSCQSSCTEEQRPRGTAAAPTPRCVLPWEQPNPAPLLSQSTAHMDRTCPRFFQPNPGFGFERALNAAVWHPGGADNTFMASMAYSTWNSLPSGEKVFTPLQEQHQRRREGQETDG